MNYPVAGTYEYVIIIYDITYIIVPVLLHHHCRIVWHVHSLAPQIQYAVSTTLHLIYSLVFSVWMWQVDGLF